MDLVVKINGEIQSSNFLEFKTEILSRLETINLEPKTDQEFSDAEALVKAFKKAEGAIDKARRDAMKNVADIDLLFNDMTEVAERIRSVRLELNRKVVEEKQRRRNEIIKDGVESVVKVIKEKGEEFPFLVGVFSCNASHFDDAVKGRRKLESIKKAVAEKADAIIAEINERSVDYVENFTKIISVKPAGLFPDVDILIAKTPGEVEAIIEKRIATHQLEVEREEREKEELERKRKQEQEQAKQEQQEQQEDKTTTKTFGSPIDRSQDQGNQTKSPIAYGAMDRSQDQADHGSKAGASTGGSDFDRFVMTITFFGDAKAVKDIARKVDSIVSGNTELVSINLKRQ